MATAARKPRASFGSSDHKLHLKYLSIESLRPDPKNPRVHSDKQLKQIARSIATFGFSVPILVDRQRTILAGHGRVAACKQLHIKTVPTICLEHLTDAQRLAFMIADNRLTENSTWDLRLLGEQLQILSTANLDFDMEITGFEMAEIDIYIEDLKAEDIAAHDPADDVLDSEPVVSVSKPDDIWCLGKHRLRCGDSLLASSYAELKAGEKANLIFADPPFNVRIDGHVSGLGKHRHREFEMASGEMSDSEFIEFLTKALNNVGNNSLDGSIHFVCMDWRHVGQLLAAGNAVYSELKNLCVWAKDSGGMGSLYRSQHELIFVFKNGKNPHRNNIQLGKFGRYRTNLWRYPGAHSFARSSSEGNLSEMHPTIKPVALIADCILDCSARGDLVLDPFVGSGTTILASERTGRVCYGLELDPRYIDVAVRRWQALTGGSATHAKTGESFRSREEAAGEKER